MTDVGTTRRKPMPEMRRLLARAGGLRQLEESMGEDEFLKRWQEIMKFKGDNETHHMEGDKLVVEALEHLGWTRLAAKWRESADHWWWA